MPAPTSFAPHLAAGTASTLSALDDADRKRRGALKRLSSDMAMPALNIGSATPKSMPEQGCDTPAASGDKANGAEVRLTDDANEEPDAYSVSRDGDADDLARSQRDSVNNRLVQVRVGRWTSGEHDRFLVALHKHGLSRWARIARDVGTRGSEQVRSHGAFPTCPTAPASGVLHH